MKADLSSSETEDAKDSGGCEPANNPEDHQGEAGHSQHSETEGALPDRNGKREES